MKFRIHLKTSERPSSLDNLPTTQEAVIEVISCSKVAQSPILEESEEIDDSDNNNNSKCLGPGERKNP